MSLYTTARTITGASSISERKVEKKRKCCRGTVKVKILLNNTFSVKTVKPKQYTTYSPKEKRKKKNCN